jgi:hypothetical protein
MITMTWTAAPAALSGLGGAAVRPCSAFGSRITVPADAAMAAPFVPIQGTGVPADGTVVRVREAFRQTGTQKRDHNYIGATNDATTLGLRTPGRPPS